MSEKDKLTGVKRHALDVQTRYNLGGKLAATETLKLFS